MKNFIVAIILVLAFFQLAGGFISPASGHALGQSLEKLVNGYFVDVGYDAIDKIYTGDAIRFDFNLWKENRSDMGDFDHVWVRIAPLEEGIVFAGFLYRPEFLLTGMSYTFQKAGQYELTIRFMDKDDKNLAEASFPLVVEKSGPALPVSVIIGAGLGIVIGAGITFSITRKKSSAGIL